jgi:hypothetical protein
LSYEYVCGYRKKICSHHFGDNRLNSRLLRIVGNFSAGESSICTMLGNRYQSKAYYRFINNDKVKSSDLVSLFGSYSSHFMSDSSVILALQDTTELDYTGNRSAAELGCMEYVHRKGLYLHTQLLVDGRGLAQGILSQSFMSRSVESLGKAAARKYDKFEDKESYRWVETFNILQDKFGDQTEKTVYSICDREGDISELLLARKHKHIHYIIRSKNNRKSPDKEHNLIEVLGNQEVVFTYRQSVVNKDGTKREAVLAVRYTSFVCNAPYRQGSKLAAIPLWVVETKEENPPVGEEEICWRLLCSQEINTAEDAKKVIGYYCFRWLIERFHYVLKQARKVEELQISSVAALKNAIVLQSWLACKILTLCYQARTDGDIDLEKTQFEAQDYEIAYQYATKVKKNKVVKQEKPSLLDFSRLIAILGGSTLQKDRPIGVVALWRGYQIFENLKQGYLLAKTCG